MRKREVLTNEVLDDVFKQLDKGDDRSLVIVGGALVENELEGLLEKTLKPSNGTNSIISSTFQAKINTAESVGIISKTEKQDLDTIIKLRNIFAHSLLVKSLADEAAAQLISKLRFYCKDTSEEDKRNLFKTTCQALIATFIFCPRTIIASIDESAYERVYNNNYSKLKNEG